jgi:hypothetical protein
MSESVINQTILDIRRDTPLSEICRTLRAAHPEQFAQVKLLHDFLYELDNAGADIVLDLDAKILNAAEEAFEA